MIFLFFGDSFDDCLTNLEKVLNRCEEKNLVLNWEKCHSMVTNSIVLGHIVSSKGIEVDKSKNHPRSPVLRLTLTSSVDEW